MAADDLTALHAIKVDGERLDRIREEIFAMAHQSELVTDALLELRAEKAALQREKGEYLALARAAQEDLDAVCLLEEKLLKRQKEVQAATDTLRTEQHDPLKERLDALRQAQGLPQLPTLEQESNERQHSYMEARMQDWNSAGANATPTGPPPKRQKKRA